MVDGEWWMWIVGVVKVFVGVFEVIGEFDVCGVCDVIVVMGVDVVWSVFLY